PITYTVQEKLPKQLSALVPNNKVDRISKNLVDNGNRISVVTDPLGNKDYYAHDALDNLTQLQDRRGQIWKNVYDRAKRRIRELEPAASITQVSQDASGALIYEAKTRSVVKKYVYDAVHNLKQKIVDEGGDDVRVISMG